MPDIQHVDISGETFRHVVVAAGTKCAYHGHPTTVLLADNKTVFCVWRERHSGPCGPIAKSEDAGLTWKRIDTRETRDDWQKANSVPCIYALPASDGAERLLVYSVIRPDSKRPAPMSLSYSDDAGESWSTVDAVKTTSGKEMQCHLPFTSIMKLENGRHLGMYQRYKDYRQSPFAEVWQATSSDGGMTWEEPHVAWDGKTHDEGKSVSPGEPELVRSPDGQKLLCLMRAKKGKPSFWMVKKDEDKDWSRAKKTLRGLMGHRHRAQYAPQVDGRLVVVFRDKARDKDYESPYIDSFVAWVGTYKDIVEGKPGQYRVKLLHAYPDRMGADCGYAGLEVLPNGTFVATTYVKYRPGSEQNSIISVRFRLEDIDRKLEQRR